jgi:hypothetical protein
MPFKGIIAVFLAALIIAVVCWKEVREDLVQWLEEDDDNIKEE